MISVVWYGVVWCGRLAADYLNDVGMTLGLLAPLVPTRTGVTVIMCVGTLFKALCGVTGGATRGTLTQVSDLVMTCRVIQGIAFFPGQ